jgi:hypothetical protein|tara:strand:- start:651 stop:947 length:297 start_codon:yes stop_codon:yes gene_type:complete
MKSILADAKASGTVTLDFGASNKTAQTAVTGIGSAKAATIILASMRIEATADHPTDDLLVDPIRVMAGDISAGVGFTVYGTMENAPANGLYRVDWAFA